MVITYSPNPKFDNILKKQYYLIGVILDNSDEMFNISAFTLNREEISFSGSKNSAKE